MISKETSIHPIGQPRGISINSRDICFRTLRHHDTLTIYTNAKLYYSPQLRIHRFHQHKYLWPLSQTSLLIHGTTCPSMSLLLFLLLPYSSTFHTTNCSAPRHPLDNNDTSVGGILLRRFLTILTNLAADSESSTIILYLAPEYRTTYTRSQLYTLPCTSFSLPLSCTAWLDGGLRNKQREGRSKA